MRLGKIGFGAMSFAIFLAFAADAWAGGWVDNWLDQATVTRPSSFQGAQRSYLNGGAVQMRWRSMTDYPVSVTPPQIRSGCGGIDAFGGSLSLLENPDYLVKKFNRILQNSAGLAFDMALQTMCEQCSTSLHKMESIADSLNGLAMNDCALAKQGVAYVQKTTKEFEDGTRTIGSTVSDIEGGASTGYMETVAAVKSTFGSTPDTSSGSGGYPGMLSGCAANPAFTAFVNIFLQQGTTVLQNIGTQVNIPVQYTDMMRGYIGDVAISWSNDQHFVFSEIPPCDDNKISDVHDFVSGSATFRSAVPGAVCSVLNDNNRNLYLWVENNLQPIYDNFSTRAAMTQNQKDFFLKYTPASTLQYLRYAAMRDQRESVGIIANMTAQSIAVAMMDDMYDRAIGLYRIAQETMKKQGTLGQNCNLSALLPDLELVHDLSARAKANKAALRPAMDAIRSQQAELDKANLGDIQRMKGEAYAALSRHLGKQSGQKFAGLGGN